MKSFILGFNRTSSQRVLKQRVDNQEYDVRNAVFDQVFLKKSEHVETDHINLTLHSLDIEYSPGEIVKGDDGLPRFNFPSFDTRHLKLTLKNIVGLYWMNKPMLEQCLQSALELDPGSIDPELVLNEEKLQKVCQSATKFDRGHRLETYAKFAMVLTFGKNTVVNALVTLPRVEINNPNRAYTFMHYLHVQEMHQLMSSQFQNWASQIYEFIRDKKIFKQYSKRIFKEHKVKQLSTDPLGVRITPAQLPQNPFIYSRQFSGGAVVGSSLKYVRLTNFKFELMSGNRTYLEYTPDFKELEALVQLARVGVQPIETFAKEIVEVVEAKAHIPKSKKFQRQFHTHPFQISFLTHLRKHRFKAVEIDRDDSLEHEETKSFDQFQSPREFQLKRLKTLHPFQLYGQSFIAELAIPKLTIFSIDSAGNVSKEPLSHEKKNMERILNEMSLQNYASWIEIMLRSLKNADIRKEMETPHTFQQTKLRDPKEPSEIESSGQFERKQLAKKKIAYWFPY